ncbi:MAG: helix-turn-helix transcriptional regulator [Ktedonobacteraceae bacterium]
MNKLDVTAITSGDYLRLPFWHSRLTLGPLVISMSLQNRHRAEEYPARAHVGNRVVTLRREHELTRQQLASLLHISYQTLQALEEGYYMPSLELAFRISTFFGIPLEAVFSYE